MIRFRAATEADAKDDVWRYAIAHGPAEIAEDDNGPICAWGYVAESLLGREAYMWFEPLRDVREFSMRFLRANRRYVERVSQIYPILHGTVDVTLPVACSWLRWLGFEDCDEVEINGRVFRRVKRVA